MTQSNKQDDKINVLKSTFLTLDESNQDYVLAILQTLKFAQNKQEQKCKEENS